MTWNWKTYLISVVTLLFAVPLRASWYSVNIDQRTDAAMSGAYLTEWQTEKTSNDVLGDILRHYSSASLATAGIHSSKWLDRKALQNAGLFTNARENYYYRRIYTLVANRITPKLWAVGYQMIQYPEKALYWGPYLFKVCEEVKQLCMIFETVVTNCSISFQDIIFLAINDNLRGLFDLAQFADVDWKAVWEHLSDFDDGLTKEALLEDLETLINNGSSIATAGGNILITEGANLAGRVHDVFHGKPGEILELYDDFEQAYHLLQNPAQIRDLVMHEILTNDSIGLSRLFKFDDYNITTYISDYLHEMQGQYYTQRWYIAYKHRGSEYVCLYDPPSLASGEDFSNPAYTYFHTLEALSPAQQEEAKKHSESLAGWSRTKVNELNAQHTGHTYHISMTGKQYLLTQGTGVIKALAYSVYVRDVWNFDEEVYSELFDSQTMDLSSMQAKMEAKLVEYNRNEEGKVYTIEKDAKNYYQAPDEERLHGVESVSFVVNCSDGTSLGEGSHSWKVDGHHGNSLSEESKFYAMESSLPSSPDTSEFDQEISLLGSSIADKQSQIQALKEENRLLRIQMAEAEDPTPFRTQYNANLATISSLESEVNELQSQLSAMEDARSEMLADYDGTSDDYTRIPSVMHDLETAYNIEWTDSGYWNGFTFIRHGRMAGFDNGVLTFRAELSLQRKPKYILGKRVHRAILAFSWSLGADYSSSDVVDMMMLDMSASEQERVNAVSQRQHEIMEEYPNCSVDLNYAYSDSLSMDDDNVTHLLWISDRLEIARKVTYRLERIYVNLVLLEKFMRYRTTILDCLKAEILSPLTRQRKSWVGNEALRRWRDSAHGFSEAPSDSIQHH